MTYKIPAYRKPAKRAYLAAYLQWVRSGEQGPEPRELEQGISYMAAQAIRLHVQELLREERSTAMTSVLRCPRCWRECSGIRCPECGIGTALVDLADSIGAEAVADRQHAAARARRQYIARVQQLDFFGDKEPVAATQQQRDLFDQCEGLV